MKGTNGMLGVSLTTCFGPSASRKVDIPIELPGSIKLRIVKISRFCPRSDKKSIISTIIVKIKRFYIS